MVFPEPQDASFTPENLLICYRSFHKPLSQVDKLEVDSFAARSFLRYRARGQVSQRVMRTDLVAALDPCIGDFLDIG